MIVYIYISKVKNIKIPLTNLLLIRKFYMIQLNRICQPAKKITENWGFCGTNENGKVFFFILSIDYINDLTNLTPTMFITFYYIYSTIDVMYQQKSRDHVLSSLK